MSWCEEVDEARYMAMLAMSDGDLEELLGRFDQTSQPLQRRILTRFVADRTILFDAMEKIAAMPHSNPRPGVWASWATGDTLHGPCPKCIAEKAVALVKTKQPD